MVLVPSLAKHFLHSLVLVPVWTKWCELESGSQEPDPEPPVIILQTRYPPNSDSYNLWAQFPKEQIASLIYKHGSQNIWKNQITGPKTAGSFAIFHGHKAPRFPDLHGQFNKGFLSAPNRAPLLTEISFPRDRYFPSILENLEGWSLQTNFIIVRGQWCPHPKF